MKKILLTFVLLALILFSVNIIHVSAEIEERHIISSKSSISEDLDFLGIDSSTIDQNMQVITFASGLKENTKSTMQLYVFFSFSEDFSNKSVVMQGTSFTKGIASFEDEFSFVSKEGNICKYEFSNSKKIYSLKSIIKQEDVYEFNIDSLTIAGFEYTEENGGYFEQRFQIKRVEAENNSYNYFVKSIDNRYVKVEADVGIRRISGEENFFTGLIGQQVYDLFYICFDVLVNENKVLYDIYQVDLEYDVEYVKRVQNIDSWDNPAHLSTSKTVVSSEHVIERVISESKSFSFSKYKWFDVFDSQTTFSVELNTLCTTQFAEENWYLNPDFKTEKSYVMFFGNTEEGYEYSKGTIYTEMNCKYHYDLDILNVSSNICQHLDVYNYEPKNVEFVEIFYRVNGFEYSVKVDETFATYTPPGLVGPGSNTKTNWPNWMPDWLIWLLEDPEGFFKALWDWFYDNVGIYLLIILAVAVLCVAMYYFSPILVPFFKILLKGVVVVITFPFKLIAKIVESARKK